MLFVRSLFYTVGIVFFIKALKLISPVTLLSTQGTAVIVNTCLFRLRRACFRKQEFGFIVPAFCGAVVCLCVIGGRFKHYGVDIVDGGRGADFTLGASYGTISGLMLAKVSRVSQALSKENLLPHEALMQFYATLMASLTVLYTLVPYQDLRLSNQLAIESGGFAWPLFALTCLLGLKVCVYERQTMSRFRMDYRRSMHALEDGDEEIPDELPTEVKIDTEDSQGVRKPAPVPHNMVNLSLL